MLASIHFTFALHSTEMRITADECFWAYYFVPASIRLHGNLILSEVAIERCSTKHMSFLLQRAVKVSGFQSLITTAMRTILDSPLAFTYRKNDGYFNFSAISVYKVSIDFWIKILGRLFVSDKQILTECFKLLSLYISIPHPNLVYDKQRKKHFSVVICLCCIMSWFEIFLSQDGVF